MFDTWFHRRKQLARYRKVRAELERLSEADLLDAGIKRYQLASIARRRALR
jgi:uncharacterized protein YjiS (DUF1127 family)